jgi:hypothetical protein
MRWGYAVTGKAVLAVLQLVGTVRQLLTQVRTVVDGESLQVGDRNLIDHSLDAATKEIGTLSQTLSDMLSDPSRIEGEGRDEG